MSVIFWSVLLTTKTISWTIKQTKKRHQLFNVEINQFKKTRRRNNLTDASIATAHLPYLREERVDNKEIVLMFKSVELLQSKIKLQHNKTTLQR